MYAKGKGSTVPSDAQAREKLALYVYEYLLHVGAQKAAQTFLSEIRWEKNITLGEPPGFLHSWWCSMSKLWRWMVSPSIVFSGNFAELIHTVTCMVLKANDRRTSSSLPHELRGPRSDYVRQLGCSRHNKIPSTVSHRQSSVPPAEEKTGFQNYIMSIDIHLYGAVQESDTRSREMY
ncbi:single-stranded DNA-binding protein 3 [Trichonephila clavipes]|nr:single-stranded DNA-binding protein 3 [Trichonephila clavipes]